MKKVIGAVLLIVALLGIMVWSAGYILKNSGIKMDFADSITVTYQMDAEEKTAVIQKDSEDYRLLCELIESGSLLKKAEITKSEDYLVFSSEKKTIQITPSTDGSNIVEYYNVKAVPYYFQLSKENHDKLVQIIEKYKGEK